MWHEGQPAEAPACGETALATATAMGGWAEDTSNPQRLRPPRWTSQRVNATEPTTAVMSRIWVVAAVIYRARSKRVIGRVPDQTIESGAGRVIGGC